MCVSRWHCRISRTLASGEPRRDSHNQGIGSRRRCVSRRIVVLAAAFATVLVVLAGTGPDAGSRAGAAQRAYDEQRFDDVLAEVARARRAGGLSPGDTVELLRLEAFVYAGFDDGLRATEAFKELLTVRPDFR